MGIVVNRTGYALGYSEKHEQAAWVAYKLTKQEVLKKAAGRTDNFRSDSLTPTGSSSLSDCRRQCQLQVLFTWQGPRRPGQRPPA